MPGKMAKATVIGRMRKTSGISKRIRLLYVLLPKLRLQGTHGCV
jgi:hypothetical protein